MILKVLLIKLWQIVIVNWFWQPILLIEINVEIRSHQSIIINNDFIFTTLHGYTQMYI